MRQRLTVVSAILAGALALAGCGKKGEERPTREAVTASLQQEADALKSDGEKLDPVLRVKATWTVEGLDVTERANDPDRPWAGTIRFKIRSDTKDTDGKVVTDEFERRFDYLYTTSVKRWIFQMPATP
jgi:predicted small lipoprotein YifL